MLSVVIATRNRVTLLGDALDSLAQQRAAPSFEVVVADNESTDETQHAVARRAANFPVALRYCYVAGPNRGAARNRGVEASTGDVIVFVDDDVLVPETFLAAHAAGHGLGTMTTVSGPILNVPSRSEHPMPTFANASRAFFCTCNASVTRAAFERAGRFDERFNLYGWEDTDLGIRLRRCGTRRTFSWDAYLYHIKPPHAESLDDALAKATEKGRMAAQLVAKDPSGRTRLATGAYAVNMARAAIVAPPWAIGWYERLAGAKRVPGPIRAFARAQAVDGTYVREMRRALRDA